MKSLKFANLNMSVNFKNYCKSTKDFLVLF